MPRYEARFSTTDFAASSFALADADRIEAKLTKAGAIRPRACFNVNPSEGHPDRVLVRFFLDAEDETAALNTAKRTMSGLGEGSWDLDSLSE